MAYPDGYLNDLRTEIEDLAIAIFGFLESAPESEIEAAKNAFAAMSKCESGGGSDHDLHNMIALWTMENTAKPTGGARPDIDIDGVLKLIEEFLDDVVFHGGVDPAGTIYGFEKYENLDPKWLEYIIGWLQHSPSSGKIATLPSGGTTMSIPDDVTIAVVGDWGTGADYSTQSAALVATAIKGHSPDYSVHLGDMYYAGTETQQHEHFLDWWGPAAGSLGSFTLNSNHDMYAGAHGYLRTLPNKMFAAQENKTHFALHNSSWVIVGLDTAGPASWDQQYMCGDVNEAQLEFLADQVGTGKRLVLLTHHQGIDETNAKYNDPLHTKIVDCVEKSRAGTEPWNWYWGHIHAGYAHTDHAAPYRGRFAGHGAIPWGNARGLDDLPGIEWYEQTQSSVGKHRVVNGFALLTLSGDTLQEQFIDETGAVTHTIPATTG